MSELSLSRKTGRGLMLAVLWMLSAGAAAQTDGLVAVDGHEFREVVNQPRAVSSTAVVGLALVPATPAAWDGRRVWVRFDGRQSAQRQVLVELESADGRYRGSGRFAGHAAPGVWVPVTLLASATRRPKDITPENISIKVSRIDAGGGQPVPVAVSWVDPAGTSLDALRLDINSRRAPSLKIRGVDKAHPCRRVASASVAVFDYHCELPLSELPNTPGRAPEVTVTRQDGFQYDSFPVPLPGGLGEGG